MSKNNGSNSWGVPFSDVTWFERLLLNHNNVTNVDRHDDIVFEVDIAEFGPLNIIYIGGGWNSYSDDAKDFCTGQRIGLYTTPEMSGGLWRNEYWSYEKPD